MNSDTISRELIHLPVAGMQDVLLARFVARREAERLAFPPALLTRVATVVSEIARNVVQHSGAAGEFQMIEIADGHHTGLRIVISDQGKGMQDPERALSGGAPAGAGLPGAAALVSKFDIQSAPGKGTKVTMELWSDAV